MTANSGFPQRSPSNGHDFPAPNLPRGYPYRIYDMARNTGFVNVGTDDDTGAFAVASIRGGVAKAESCIRGRQRC